MSRAWRIRTAGGILLAFLASPGATAELPSVQERLGHPASARLLVLHADDLGMSRSVNRATFEALEQGWITSASVLVPCPWFPDVARWAQAHPEADLGIHLALNSEWTGYRWGPLGSRDKIPSLLDPDGYLPLAETAVVARARPASASPTWIPTWPRSSARRSCSRSIAASAPTTACRTSSSGWASEEETRRPFRSDRRLDG